MPWKIEEHTYRHPNGGALLSTQKTTWAGNSGWRRGRPYVDTRLTVKLTSWVRAME